MFTFAKKKKATTYYAAVCIVYDTYWDQDDGQIRFPLKFLRIDRKFVFTGWCTSKECRISMTEHSLHVTQELHSCNDRSRRGSIVNQDVTLPHARRSYTRVYRDNVRPGKIESRKRSLSTVYRSCSFSCASFVTQLKPQYQTLPLR